MLVLISFIVACVVASKLQKSNDAIDQASSFSVVWTCLLLILISIVGTVIMRSVSVAVRLRRVSWRLALTSSLLVA